MVIAKIIGIRFSAFRRFVWPDYRPECHYMRGPGPACARRHKGA